MCQGKVRNAGRLQGEESQLNTGNIAALQISLVDLEAVDDEAEEGAEEASPGCEVEEMSPAGHHREYAGGHADSTTEIQHLQLNLVMFKILNK